MSRSPSNSIPFTTRPASTSRQGMILRASVIARTPENCAARGRRFRRIFPDETARRARLRSLDHRRERKAVIAGRDRRLAAGRRGIGMREIKIGVFRNAAKQLARLHAPQLIPADVRRFHVRRQRADFLREKAEARSPGASSLDANIACRPRQIPRIGTPES